MTPAAVFEQTAGCGDARAGVLRLRRGSAQTPTFMPVGTLAAIKGGLLPADLEALGVEIILANTFHLWQRPGEQIIAAHGGLHGFGGWQRPILTDSGGYQIFSLRAMRRLCEAGAHFRAPHNGAPCFMSPESCVAIQRALNSDICMVLDECPPPNMDEAAAAASMRRSLRWAARCKAEFARQNEARGGGGNALFGIAQGGVFQNLRDESAAATAALGFDGVAIGGLAVGEAKEDMRAVLRHTAPRLPANKPRYLMGVGAPADIVYAVQCGVDLFDCVLPTRNARNGQLFTSAGIVRIRNARHRDSDLPPDENCACPVCRRFSRAYLRHLFVTGEMLAARLATLHNLAFFVNLMQRLRAAIVAGNLKQTANDILQHYPPQ